MAHIITKTKEKFHLPLASLFVVFSVLSYENAPEIHVK